MRTLQTVEFAEAIARTRHKVTPPPCRLSAWLPLGADAHTCGLAKTMQPMDQTELTDRDLEHLIQDEAGEREWQRQREAKEEEEAAPLRRSFGVSRMGTTSIPGCDELDIVAGS